jgi:hypothetical protein
MRENDLLARTFTFGVNCLIFFKKIPNDPESKLIRFQLGKSATSIALIMRSRRPDLLKQILEIK